MKYKQLCVHLCYRITIHNRMQSTFVINGLLSTIYIYISVIGVHFVSRVSTFGFIAYIPIYQFWTDSTRLGRAKENVLSLRQSLSKCLFSGSSCADLAIINLVQYISIYRVYIVGKSVYVGGLLVDCLIMFFGRYGESYWTNQKLYTK